ncbi:MAG: nuclear transport factor 2 family protein [Nitrospinota bacterium]|nr:nuclear transport factor 2 family protein [Nitrospinota bacterium]
MLNISRILTAFAVLISLTVAPNPSLAGETDALTDLLKQIDKQICTSPKKLMNFYDKEMVIISDDKRILPENRIKDYEMMIAELQGMKCNNTRTVLSGNADKTFGYLLVDELISVSSLHSTDERQHSVCTYVFSKDSGQWKIKQEHCSSLPDYSIVPGDDALYYFHNPVY